MRTIRRILCALAMLCVLVPGLAPGQTAPGQGQLVVGKAGGVFISEEEFVRRFELTPGLYRHRAGRLEEEKLIVLYSLIAEKLLAQEADARGISADSAAAAGVAHLTGLLARDALYRQEVSRKVVVTPEEVRRGARNALRQLLVEYLFFPAEEDARFVASQRKGADLRTLAMDSSMHALRDTVTVVWGAAEEPVEQAAYGLKAGEVSPLLRTSKGWMLLHLVAESRNGLYAAMTPSVRRERVESALRLRKEEARLEEFTRAFVAGRTGYTVPSRLKAAAVALSRELVPEAGGAGFVLSSEAARGVRVRLESVLGDSFLVAGARVWTTGEVITRLEEEHFRASSHEPLALAGALSARCRIWVLQELLTQEALRRGLDRSPEVTAQLKEWRESYLAQLMRARVEGSVKVTETDVLRYRELNGRPLPVPRVRIRELKTGSVEEMRLAMGALERGMAFAEAVRAYSADPVARQSGGLSELFPVTGRPPVGEIAAGLAPGQMYGPLPVEGGMLLFQLVEKSDPARSDTSLAAQKAESAAELLRLLRKQALDRFIAEAAQKRGYTVYADRLKALRVTPLPMTAFRVLGFGGRMFAAPLMPRLFEWTSTPVPEPALAP